MVKFSLYCSSCKSQQWVLHPIGSKSLCNNCLKQVHGHIISKIDNHKLKNISYLEQDILIELYFFSIEHNIKCDFQFKISKSCTGCALEQAAERDGYDFNCARYDEDCEICDYFYSYLYTKYILDFSLKKDMVKVDLELDGVRFHENKKEYDSQRNNFMEKTGWIVLRYDSSVIFKNKSKIFKDLKKVFCLQDFDLNKYKGKEHDNKLLY